MRSNTGVINATVQAQTGLIVTATTTATNATNIATSMRDGGTAVTLNSGSTIGGLGQSLSSWMSGVSSRFNDANAYVVSQIAASTGPGSSIASSIGTLQSTVGSHTGTNTTLYETSNGLVNRNTLTMVSGSGSNKVVTGYSILNGPNTSQISFLASVFSIVDTVGGTPITVFEVSGGWVRCPKLIAGDIVAGTITADKIVTGAVDGTKIPNNTINNYHITSGAISSAGTATSPSAVSAVTPTTGSPAYAPDLTIQTVTITAKGGQVVITGGFSAFQQQYDSWQDGTDHTIAPVFVLLRNGSVIDSYALPRPIYTGVGPTRWQTYYRHPVSFSENVTAGTYTYEVRVTGIPGNLAISVGDTGIAYAATGRHLAALEIAKTGT
jgi:hypothetical protein